MIATSPIDILRFLSSRIEEGEDIVLVTLTGIEMTSSRALGTQMAVAADRSYAGSFSGGCVEAAVVSEALDVLAANESRLVRFGVDSPYLDIRLPCGGGVDLLFNPRPDAAAIGSVLARLDARESAALMVTGTGVSEWSPDQPVADGFLTRYAPPLRIVAIGQGEDLTAFARLAHRFGANVTALTADDGGLLLLKAEGIEAFPLLSRESLPEFRSDPWTAIVFLFHDRDWEEGLLPHALARSGFYHGAVGSRRTQAARLPLLRSAGVPEAAVEALRGPIGLIPATRDPATLALSILAEIVEAYHLLPSQPR